MMKKLMYSAPETEVLALRSEGIICESGTDAARDAYGTILTLDLTGD